MSLDHVRLTRRLALKTSLSAITGAGLLSACGGSSEVTELRDRRVAVAAGVSLQVREWGPVRASLTYVLLAGLGGNARGFDSLGPALAAGHNTRVVAVSRRGYGKSDKPLPSSTGPRYDPATLVEDLRVLMDALEIDRAVLVGHSIASNELTRFAGTYPLRTRGLAYFDTTFDYTRVIPDAGIEEPQPGVSPLAEPEPGAADLASMSAAIAFSRRINKNWSAPLEAQLRDSLHELPDGRVQVNTPDDVARDMVAHAHAFSPDYRAVRARALVVSAYPSTWRDLFPWLPDKIDANTRSEAEAMLRAVREGRAADAALLVAALPGSTLLRVENSSHADFFIEHEEPVLRALRFMQW
ncbi:hypothetical protein CDN99_24120 [Roseateles aquatilis]|uniref:AB hydrolase-1 domain-containing protein n=1 Tax=Roseateles aquatilis TaxID=431061 RepID=A0A246IVY6_9BURK|nr:alpha/beta hydrolase [Roseateles aquatilis]OWQ84385.1 hypothetical protein CDN99_24120 [Roseateles aquatilis]